MRRRQFVGTLGAAGIAAAISGCSRIDLPRNDQFKTVVNMASAGADTSGQTSITGLLKRKIGDNTLCYFPEGTYLMDEMVSVKEFSNLGIVGENATIVPPDGYTRVLFDFGGSGQASDLLMEGIEFDFRAPNTGPRPINAKVGGRLVLRDISVTGVQDDGWGMLRLDVTDEGGVGIVKNLRLPDGATSETGSTGCLVGNLHRGTITFVDCHIAGFPDNGLYAEPERGTVYVLGGYYANSGVSNVRVSNGGLIRGAHVRCDTVHDGFDNMRGIRLREGRGTVVENCTVEMLDVSQSDGAIVMESFVESAVIRDTNIRIDTDSIAAIVAKDPDRVKSKRTPPKSMIRCENIHITGSAANRASVRIVNRDESILDRLNITQTGDDRDGIHLVNTGKFLVSNSKIDVTGDPFVLDRSSIEKINVVTKLPAG